MEEKFKKIDEFSKALGLDDDKEKTVFEIIEDDDKNKKTLCLKSGSWGNEEPWFGVDKDDDIHIMVSLKSLMTFMNSYKNMAIENFDLRLEKTILKQLPIDFGDVWVVCMDEIKNMAKQNQNETNLNINLDDIVKKVKEKYPNLFVDMSQFLNKDGANRYEN